MTITIHAAHDFITGRPLHDLQTLDVPYADKAARAAAVRDGYEFHVGYLRDGQHVATYTRRVRASGSGVTVGCGGGRGRRGRRVKHGDPLTVCDGVATVDIEYARQGDGARCRVVEVGLEEELLRRELPRNCPGRCTGQRGRRPAR